MINIFIPLLNFLLPLIGRFFNKLEKQNHYNTPEQERIATLGGHASQVSTKKVLSETEPTLTEKQIQIFFPVTRFPIHITSRFGFRDLWGTGKLSFHNGVDFRTWESPECVAVEDSIVKKIVDVDPQYPERFKYDPATKTWKEIAPSGRAWTPYIVLVGKYSKNMYVYKHVKKFSNIKLESEIKAGEKFCISGNYGYSKGIHLHFEFRNFNEEKNEWDKETDPMEFFRKMNLNIEVQFTSKFNESDFMKKVEG